MVISVCGCLCKWCLQGQVLQAGLSLSCCDTKPLLGGFLPSPCPLEVGSGTRAIVGHPSLMQSLPAVLVQPSSCHTELPNLSWPRYPKSAQRGAPPCPREVGTIPEQDGATKGCCKHLITCSLQLPMSPSSRRCDG